MHSTKNTVNQVNKLEWICFKLSFILPVLIYLFYGFTRFNGLLSPSGICKCIDCSLLARTEAVFFLSFFCLVGAWLYIAEKCMMATLAVLALICLVCLSYEQSAGITTETGLISLFFSVQLIAYFLKHFAKDFRLEKYRLQFPKQLVAAVYTLSGISKIIASGKDWFTNDASKFGMEIMRVHYTKFSATGNVEIFEKGKIISGFLMENPQLLSALLLSSLFLEISSGLILINKKVALWYGVLLVIFHMVIYFTLDITYPTIMIPMILVCINPVYLLVSLIPKA